MIPPYTQIDEASDCWGSNDAKGHVQGRKTGISSKLLKMRYILSSDKFAMAELTK